MMGADFLEETFFFFFSAEVLANRFRWESVPAGEPEFVFCRHCENHNGEEDRAAGSGRRVMIVSRPGVGNET